MPTCRVDWPQAWRVIASRYPPINLFERLTADTAVWDALMALEQLTNPRVRDEVGDIALVPPDERVSGPGASYVMAAFTHVNPKGSRFSDGSFGVYYAAAALETAIAETVFHFEAFARDSADPPRSEDMRVLVGTVAADFEDVAALPDEEQRVILDPRLLCGIAGLREAASGGRRERRGLSERPACRGTMPRRLPAACRRHSAPGAPPEVSLERRAGRSLLRLRPRRMDRPLRWPRQAPSIG